MRDGKVVAREGFLLDRLTEPEPRPGLDPAAVLRRRALRAPRGRGPGGDPRPGAARGLAGRAAGTLVRIHVPQRGEKLRLLELVVRNAAAGVRARVEAPAPAVAGDPARRCGTSSTSRWSPSASSASTSRTSRARTSWPRWWSSRRACPKKADYRKFRVKGVSGAPDDFASMREVVGRRYKRLLEEGKDLPDLVLIDGGKGQLGAAVYALEELGLGDQPVASPREAGGADLRPRPRGAHRPAALLAGAAARPARARRGPPLRRSASTARRAPSRTLRSELDDIPGHRPRASAGSSCRVFGSVRGVRGATEAELATAVGKATAARVRRALRRGSEGVARPGRCRGKIAG